VHPFADRWNHNTHYYPLLRAALPDSTARLLDVGCGDGTFCHFAASPSRTVVGVDTDAGLMSPRDGVRFVVGSAESLGFADATFDAVTMTMVLHHVDAARALAEAARVLRVGGLLQVLGIGRLGGPRDLPHEVRDVVSHRLVARRHRAWEPDTAKAAPTETWAEALATARRVLPGCTWDRLPMWRYRVTWTKS
jgi:ubiquinone/menaquinone biosynthesis C-methylase UbiE